MNKLKTLTLGLLATVTLFATSCKKDDPKPDERQSIVTISTPTEGEKFAPQATVNITGEIKSSDELHGYQVVIRKKSDNSIVFEQNKHTHGTTVTINETWINDLHGHNDMELEVIGVLDHDGNTISNKVNFHCHGH